MTLVMRLLDMPEALEAEVVVVAAAVFVLTVVPRPENVLNE